MNIQNRSTLKTPNKSTKVCFIYLLFIYLAPHAGPRALLLAPGGPWALILAPEGGGGLHDMF